MAVPCDTQSKSFISRLSYYIAALVSFTIVSCAVIDLDVDALAGITKNMSRVPILLMCMSFPGRTIHAFELAPCFMCCEDVLLVFC
jgi:hypothetical protein